jgi:hypothetical protein
LIERNTKISSHLNPLISTKKKRRVKITLNGFDDLRHGISSGGIYDLAAEENPRLLFAGT